MGLLTSGNKGDPLKDRKNDCYETPEEATIALLTCESLPPHIWEPACGPGAIVRILRASGYRVSATDLVDYGCLDSQPGIDFLMEWKSPDGVQAIVTNPPFKNGADFVRKGLELCSKVIILQRLAFMEGDSRADIIDGGKLARVHVFRNRLPMMHRYGWEGPELDKTMAAYAWFVFDREHTGPTIIDRISWVERAAAPVEKAQQSEWDKMWVLPFDFSQEPKC